MAQECLLDFSFVFFFKGLWPLVGTTTFCNYRRRPRHSLPLLQTSTDLCSLQLTHILDDASLECASADFLSSAVCDSFLP